MVVETFIVLSIFDQRWFLFPDHPAGNTGDHLLQREGDTRARYTSLSLWLTWLPVAV